MEHTFEGRWISDSEFYRLESRNVFHRQLDKISLPCDAHRNRHILFRKKFNIANFFKKATLYISADDYYKLYVNGKYVTQGPAPSYHFAYNYNVIDISSYLKEGENVIALHTLYQGLINRVWQSGDNRHGLILDLIIDGVCTLSSDRSFLTHPHSAYKEIGVCGYDTQFLESYDCRAREVGFESPDFDDSYWEHAETCRYDDHRLKDQRKRTWLGV